MTYNAKYNYILYECYHQNTKIVMIGQHKVSDEKNITSYHFLNGLNSIKSVELHGQLCCMQNQQYLAHESDKIGSCLYLLYIMHLTSTVITKYYLMVTDVYQLRIKHFFHAKKHNILFKLFSFQLQENDISINKYCNTKYQ